MALETLDFVGSGMEEKWEREGKTGEGLFSFVLDSWDVGGSVNVLHTGA